MSILRRQLDANGGLDTPIAVQVSSKEAANLILLVSVTQVDAPTESSTISPYQHGLNGVNQPINMVLKDALWGTLGLFAVAMLLIRSSEMMRRKLRLASAMRGPSDKQKYWMSSQWGWMPGIKKHLVYAPLWKKRHSRRIQITRGVAIGTLPSRLSTLILSLYLMSNLAYMLVLNWNQENRFAFAAELRGRSGTLAVANMVPLVILAGRNNPLIALLQISFDSYNLLHRWMGRMVVAEALIHTIAWLYVQVADGGWESVNMKRTSQPFIASGISGAVCLVALLILSLSPFRSAFYESFLNLHIILAMAIFVLTYVHCVTADIGPLPQTSWVVAICPLWLGERLARVLRISYFNWSARGVTEAVVTAMPGGACRVDMRLPRYVDVKPGSHAYLRFCGTRVWESHPFSIAWVEHLPLADDSSLEKGKAGSVDQKRGVTAVSFVIGVQSGFTRALYNKANKASNKVLHVRAAMEGPYAGHHSLNSYGHVVLFAGATGITHQLSYIKPLLQGFEDKVVATRRITLIWVIRDHDLIEWIRPWVDQMLCHPSHKEILRIRVFVTRPKNPTGTPPNSNAIQLFSGRPDVRLLLKEEVDEQVGAMCVTACGPGALADNIRQAVRECQSTHSVVDFIEERFTW